MKNKIGHVNASKNVFEKLFSQVHFCMTKKIYQKTTITYSTKERTHGHKLEILPELVLA